MIRYTRFPITLYRIQRALPVSLRDYDTAMSKGRTSFDFKLHDGLVLPMEGSKFHTPNGMYLRPGNDKMRELLANFKGDQRVFRMHEGMEVPKEFVLIHEHSDHYSMQTSEPIDLQSFNDKLTKFLQNLPSQTKEQFIEQYDDVDDQDG